MPEEHARLGLGGSSANRTINCPGWAAEASKLPAELLNRSSPFAEEGTRLHGEIEACLRVGNTPKSEKVMRALQRFKEFLEDVGPVDPDDIFLEVRVDLEGIPGAWGTSDVVIDAPDAIVILDWKFGDGVIVNATGNDQLMFYAVGTVDTLFEAVDDDETVILAIVQPHMRGGDILSRWDTTVGALRDWKRRFAAALSQSYLCVGPWCRWCDAQVICPETRRRVTEAIKTDVEALQPDELGKWLALGHDLASFTTKLEELAHRQMEGGVKIPGWKLVAKRATRKWADAKSALKYFESKFSLDEVAPRVLLSPAKMEKVCEIPAGLVNSMSTGLCVAPESDKRSPVMTNLNQIATNIRKRKEHKK